LSQILPENRPDGKPREFLSDFLLVVASRLWLDIGAERRHYKSQISTPPSFWIENRR